MRLLCISILLLLVIPASYSQDHDFHLHDKLPFQESRSFHFKSAFIEDQSYADYDLIYQRMEWEVDPSVHYIEGAITSYFKALNTNLSSISFDLIDQLQVDSIIYHETHIDFTHANDKIIIQFPKEIPISTIDSLTIWYQGKPLSSGFGAFQVQNTAAGDPILWTLSEPYGAREWWPCKQSLTDKIDSVKIVVTCPEGNKVGSNGKLISEESTDGKTVVTCKHKHPIVTYLVAIAVSNYSEYSDFLELEDGRQIEILNYVYPSYLNTAKSTSNDVLRIMELFNELIGEYPFADEKYGHAQFGWSGGMEHQTMSFMADLRFSLVAHEMAHQWFGDYITLGSWHDIWLNEGFATYFEGLTREYLQTESSWTDWKNYRVNRITEKTGGSVYVEDTTNVSRIFDGRLSYSKGAYLLHMLRWELGDDNFFDAIRNYFDDPNVANGFATNDELIYHLEQAGDTTFTEFFDDWYYGEGYPSYSINFIHDETNNQTDISITQSTSHSSVDLFEMHVPLRITENGESKDIRLHQTTNHQNFTISGNPEEIEFDPEKWLISKNSIVTSSPNLGLTEFSIYPNPVSNNLFYQLNSSEKVKTIKIVDLSGQVLPWTTRSHQSIDISSLSPGVYFIEVETNTKEYKNRFVKIR